MNALILTMTLTAYTPGGGGINSGLYGAHCHARVCTVLHEGHAACGARWPYHTTFVVDGEPYLCLDRGSAIGNYNLDIVRSDIKSAFAFGVRRHRVEVWRPGAYEMRQRELRRLE